jgi:hypothetical protein
MSTRHFQAWVPFIGDEGEERFPRWGSDRAEIEAEVQQLRAELDQNARQLEERARQLEERARLERRLAHYKEPR